MVRQESWNGGQSREEGRRWAEEARAFIRRPVRLAKKGGKLESVAGAVSHGAAESPNHVETRSSRCASANNRCDTSPVFTLPHLLALLGSSLGAGLMNAMAGGGTILTFPVLLLLGESAITANATSTVALLPGAVGSMFGYRREIATHRDWLRTLALPSILGGAAGSVLLLRTPESAFRRLAPVLILFATVLFMFQGMVARWMARREAAAKPEAASRTEVPRAPEGAFPAGRLLAASVFQLAVAVYGGYFGAGIGILMLAVLGFLGLSDIHAMNGLKNFFGMCINGVAALYFISRGAVNWPAALVMAVGALAGGYSGARLARRMGRDKARGAVIFIGLLVAAILFWQQEVGG